MQQNVETKLTQQLNIGSNKFNNSTFPIISDSMHGNTSSFSLNSTNNFEKIPLNNGNKQWQQALEAYLIYKVFFRCILILNIFRTQNF